MGPYFDWVKGASARLVNLVIFCQVMASANIGGSLALNAQVSAA